MHPLSEPLSGPSAHPEAARCRPALRYVRVAVSLASSLAAWVTGEIVDINGGTYFA